MNNNIILATKDDTEEIMALYKEQLGREFCAWDEDYPSYETIDYDLSRDALFVMKEAGKIVAAISIEYDEAVEELKCWSDELAPGGELARVAVTPSMQNKGLARLMMQHGMDELKKMGHKSVHFLVNKYNQKAIRSYAAFGFNVVGECFMYDQDFLCYEKSL